MKKESKGCRTDVVLMGKAEEAGKGSVEGVSQEALAGLYFTPLPDYPQVGVMGQRILCGAAEVVVRMYPEKLDGVDFSNPVMAIHVLDLFFASRLGENLEDPSRRILRNALVYCHDIVQAGTPGRGQAALCMESVRYVVSSLLVLV